MMKVIIYFTVLALLEEQEHSALLNGLILSIYILEVIKKGLDSQRKFISMSHYLWVMATTSDYQNVNGRIGLG
jgi:hypothetical protein